MRSHPSSSNLFASLMVLLFCAASLWSFTLPQSTGGPEVGHTLRGKVYTNAGSAPDPPVKVRLIYSGAPIGESFTDAGGNYGFVRVRDGNYQLIVEGDD